MQLVAKFNPKAKVSEAVVSVIFCKALFGEDECTADAGEAFYARANEVNIEEGVMAFEKSNLRWLLEVWYSKCSRTLVKWK
jgi:hypothetical protein